MREFDRFLFHAVYVGLYVVRDRAGKEKLLFIELLRDFHLE